MQVSLRLHGQAPRGAEALADQRQFFDPNRLLRRCAKKRLEPLYGFRELVGEVRRNHKQGEQNYHYGKHEE
jgi:hypothetical protein